MDICHAYTGKHVHVDNPDRFLSLDEVRSLVQDQFQVPSDQQLLLVARTATPLKLELVAHGTDIVLYDKRLFQVNGQKAKAIAEDQDQDQGGDQVFDMNIVNFVPEPCPDDDNLRLTWAMDITTKSKYINQQIMKLESSIVAIKQGVEVAARNLKAKVAGVQKSFETKLDLAVSLDEDVELTLKQWHFCYEKLSIFPFYRDNLEYGDLEDNDTDQTADGTLKDLFQLQTLEDNSLQCLEVRKNLQQEIQTLDAKVHKLKSDVDKLDSSMKQSLPTFSAKFDYVIEDLDAVYAKIKKDIEHMQSQPPNETKNALRQLHDTEFMPMFPNGLNELQSGLTKALNAKKEAQNTLLTTLAKISQIENILSSSIRPEVTSISIKLQKVEDLRVVVAQVIDLPYLYGLLLVEKLARNVWVDKMRNNTSYLAEKLAEMRSSEFDKRESVFKDMQFPEFLKTSLVQSANEDMPEIDISIRTIKKYGVTSVMIQKYLNVLKEAGFEEEYDELNKKYHDDVINLASQLRVPTLAQQQTTASYEQKINGYELRIKKLESLLLRQQASASAIGGGYNATTPQNSSGTIPTLNSVNSGNVSIAASSDTREIRSSTVAGTTSSSLLERVHELEETKKNQDSEITKLRNQVAQMESAIGKHEVSAKQADSLKADLLANMTNKETEFVSERNELTREIEDLKVKVDGLEEEVETSQGEVARLNSLLEEAKNSLDEQINSKSRLQDMCRDLSQKLFTSYVRGNEVLHSMGLQAVKNVDDEKTQTTDGNSVNYKVNRVKGLRKSGSVSVTNEVDLPNSLYWMNEDESVEDENFTKFLNHVYVDYDIYRDAVSKRFSDVEHLARKLQKELKLVRQSASPGNRNELESASPNVSLNVSQNVAPSATDEHEKFKIALRDFRVGDLALFLPTKENRVPKPWAAFNIGAPHYFLKPMPSQHLESREYLVARITKIEERVVDKTLDDSETNPFDLSDGLKWYFLEVSE